MWPAPCGLGVTPTNTTPLVPTAWQVLHPLLIPVWFMLAPENVLKLLVEWQLSHSDVVGICNCGIPVASVPLWQLAQLPGAIPLCLKFVGLQAMIWWQVSQDWLVGRCCADFPVAAMPLWQLAQLPGVTAGCAKTALSIWNESVRWHTSQLCVVGI